MKLLEHLGPYLKHGPAKTFCSISERAFIAFHDAIGGRDRSEETPRQFLYTKMMYVAETTSAAIRLNTSWALSLPGMSLTRDRYEQVLRFSWLARQPDHTELVKYIGYHYAKIAAVQAGLSPEQKAAVAEVVEAAPINSETPPTKEERAFLERWGKLDLANMAAKRDALPSPTPTQLGSETLADLYTPIYRQFSSASHYDMYSMNMIGLYPTADGGRVLAPDPNWPAVLCMYNALFDLIQCNEAMTAFYNVKDTSALDGLHNEWVRSCESVHSKFAPT